MLPDITKLQLSNFTTNNLVRTWT